MKLLKIIHLIVSFYLLSFSSIAQLSLGEATFSHFSAVPLRRSEAILDVLSSMEYLGKVGGVAFDKEAIPANGLSIADLKLHYDADAADGRRLSVTINDQTVTAPIYDWELVPIAKYANSTYTACFTLFGSLENNERAQQLTDDGNRILNYHPELQNTLLGLRLFQLDILIFMPELSTDLPKWNGEYLLGAGEHHPNIAANKRGYQNFESAIGDGKDQYTSYLICDHNRTITFSTRNDSLYISGQPYYHFWQFNTSTPSFQESVEKQLAEEVAAHKQNGTVQTWLLNQLRSEISKLADKDPGALYLKITQHADEIRQKYGQAVYIEALEQAVSEGRIANAPKSVVPRSSLSTSLSSQPGLFRNINPAIWNAAVMTMRYSAFFRYCKSHFPDQWNSFLAQIRNVTIAPTVETPTVLHPNGN